MEIRIETQVEVTFNGERGWRQWVANKLHRIASNLDKRHVLAVEILTLPPITDEQRTECVEQGVKAIHEAVDQQIRFEASEVALKILQPQLYEED